LYQAPSGQGIPDKTGANRVFALNTLEPGMPGPKEGTGLIIIKVCSCLADSNFTHPDVVDVTYADNRLFLIRTLTWFYANTWRGKAYDFETPLGCLSGVPGYPHNLIIWLMRHGLRQVKHKKRQPGKDSGHDQNIRELMKICIAQLASDPVITILTKSINR
jgi:hypothetical protein